MSFDTDYITLEECENYQDSITLSKVSQEVIFLKQENDLFAAYSKEECPDNDIYRPLGFLSYTDSLRILSYQEAKCITYSHIFGIKDTKENGILQVCVVVGYKIDIPKPKLVKIGKLNGPPRL